MKAAAETAIAGMRQVDPDATVRIRYWDDTETTVGDGPPRFTIHFNTKRSLQRCLGEGFNGFAESYEVGEIEVDGDLQHLFRLGHQIGIAGVSLPLTEKIRFALQILLNRNSLRGSRKNNAHYDIGTDFHELFLDEKRTFTCAYFKSPDESLEQAQVNKYEYICRKLLLREGETLVELGSGWGGFMLHAAQHHGIRGVGVMLGKSQVAHATEEARALGVDDRVEFRLQDYREVEGLFDKAVSIGMMEHVGKDYIPTFCKKIASLTKPKGLALMHFCGNDMPYPDDPWISKIFPGTHIPALSHVLGAAAQEDLNVLDVENLRQHYVPTIDAWIDRYERNFDRVAAKYGNAFARAWRLYLVACSTSMEVGGNRIFQVLFSKGLNNALPMTRAHLYA